MDKLLHILEDHLTICCLSSVRDFVVGIDHVGIGTDFDGGGGLEDCFDVSQIKNATIELVKRGYSEKEIEKIWSGNFMRVFTQVQQLAEN